MIIRDVHYNITNIAYSVHFKNKPIKRIKFECFTYTCMNRVVISKTCRMFNHNIYNIKHYLLKPFKLSRKHNINHDGIITRLTLDEVN